MFDCFKKKKKVRTRVIEIEEVVPQIPVNNGDATMGDLKTNERGIELITFSEGFYPIAYKDPIGLPTIGYGTIIYPNGVKVKMGDSCTKLEALEWLRYEIDEKENVIENYLDSINMEYSSNEFSALVSFGYNLGNGPIITNGKSMNRALKSGDRAAIADSFLLYNKARVRNWMGVRVMKALRGLTIRRQSERKLFLTPDKKES